MNGLSHFRGGILATLDSVVGRIEAWTLGWSILALAGFTVANVIGRFVFDRSIYFMEELSEFLMVLITFFGLG